MGCSLMSKKDCETANWQSKGYSDAINGETANKFANYKNNCSEHGIKPDLDKYAKGRAMGLKKFCTYKNGYRFGLQGGYYKDICPATIETEFFKGYTLGKKEYQLEKREEEIKNRERRLEAKQKIFAQHGAGTCTFNSDCKIKDDCSLKKCEKSGKTCNVDSDCEIEGRCDSESEYAGGEWRGKLLSV